MKKLRSSGYIHRRYNNSNSRFKTRGGRSSIVNRSNLRVIEAQSDTSGTKVDIQPNNIIVSAGSLPEKVKQDLMKGYKDDLDEISDSPLVDDADDLENVSEGSLYGDSENELNENIKHLSMEGEVPVGYRKYTVKHLPKYKRIAFFKPRVYCVSTDRIIVGCVNTISANKIVGDDVVSNVTSVDLNKSLSHISNLAMEDIPEPFQGTVSIHEDLSKSDHTLLGLEFLVEIWTELGITLKNYQCLLCETELEKDMVLNHFISINHRVAYLDKRFPKFTTMFFKNTENGDVKLPIENVCRNVLGTDTASPFITTANYVNSYKHKLKKRVNSLFVEKDEITSLLSEVTLIVEAYQELPANSVDLTLYNSVVCDMADDTDSESVSSTDDILILEEVSFKSQDKSENENQEQISEEEILHSKDKDSTKLETKIKEQDKKSLSVKDVPKSLGKYHNSRCNKHYRTRMHHVEKGSALSKKVSETTVKTSKVTGNSNEEKAKKSNTATKRDEKSVTDKSNRSKRHEDKNKTSPKHCEKCNGVRRRNYGDHKQLVKDCDCKKISSNDSKPKQKEISSKESSLRKLDHSKSTSSSQKQKANHSTRRPLSKDVSNKTNEKTVKSKDNIKGNGSTTVKVPKDRNMQSSSSKPSSRSLSHKSSTKLRKISPKRPVHKRSKSPIRVSNAHQRSPFRRDRSSHGLVRRSPKPPVLKRSRSPFGIHRRRSRSPVVTRHRSRSPAVVRHRSRSPFNIVRQRTRSPINKRHSRSPRGIIRRLSRSPVNRRYSKSPLRITQRRSRSPIINRHSLSSFGVTGRRSRSPIVNRRLRSPLNVHQRSKSPFNIIRKRSKSPYSSRSHPLSPKHSRTSSRLLNILDRRVRSPDLRRKKSRSPLKKQIRNDSKGRNSDSKRFVDPFHKFQKPALTKESTVSVSHQPFPIEAPPVTWQDGYNYNYQQPTVNPAFPPSTFPPYIGQPAQVPNSYVPQVPYYQGAAYLPPPVNTLPPQNLQSPNIGYAPPGSLPPASVSSFITNLPPNPSLQYSMLGGNILPKHNENAFHDLRNAVTKIFGAPVSNTQSNNTNNVSNDSKNESYLGVNIASTSSTSGAPNLLQNPSTLGSKDKIYLETLQKLKKEFGTLGIPDDVLKHAVRGLFPEEMLKDCAFQFLKENESEQKEVKQTKLPDMNAKVEFKESVDLPRQGNIFPIVKKDTFSRTSSMNSNNRGQESYNPESPTHFKPDSYYEAKQNPNQKTLAQRLASVLVKLGMVDVPGSLLAEMLHKIGAFNRSLPLQDITENQIISLLDKYGYLRK